MTGVGGLLAGLLCLVQLLVLARIALDWTAMLASPTAGRLLTRPRTAVHRLSEPLLAPLRRVLPSPRLGVVRLDLAPAALLIILVVTQSLLVRL